MPNDGDEVTVRAVLSMPGVDEGQVQVVQWGPRLATLVDQGRYDLIEEPPQPAPPVETVDAPTTAVAVPVDDPPDVVAGDVPTPVKRGRAR